MDEIINKAIEKTKEGIQFFKEECWALEAGLMDEEDEDVHDADYKILLENKKRIHEDEQEIKTLKRALINRKEVRQKSLRQTKRLYPDEFDNARALVSLTETGDREFIRQVPYLILGSEHLVESLGLNLVSEDIFKHLMESEWGDQGFNIGLNIIPYNSGFQAAFEVSSDDNELRYWIVWIFLDIKNSRIEVEVSDLFEVDRRTDEEQVIWINRNGNSIFPLTFLGVMEAIENTQEIMESSGEF